MIPHYHAQALQRAQRMAQLPPRQGVHFDHLPGDHNRVHRNGNGLHPMPSPAVQVHESLAGRRRRGLPLLAELGLDWDMEVPVDLIVPDLPVENGQPRVQAGPSTAQVEEFQRKNREMRIEMDFKAGGAGTCPHGAESMIYWNHDVYMFRRPSSDFADDFRGEIQGPKELLWLYFSLMRKEGNDQMDLVMSDLARHPLYDSPMALARFYQAEVFLQFFKLDKDDRSKKTLVYEGLGDGTNGTMHVCFEYPNANVTNGEQFAFRTNKSQDMLSVTFFNVIPRATLNNALLTIDQSTIFMMRVSMKLIAGNLDHLYGMQLLFSPSNDVEGMRNALSQILLDTNSCDLQLICGNEDRAFLAHRSVLTANSDVFKAMLESDMREKQTGEVQMPPYVSADVLTAFLSYIYFRNRIELEQDPIRTVNVLQLADFYNVPGLMSMGKEAFLAMSDSRFTLEKALHAFRIAHLNQWFEIQTKCVHVILRMDVIFAECNSYLAFAKKDCAAAARLTDLIAQFRKANCP